MTRPAFVLASLAVTVALACPAIVEGQARPRGGSDGGGGGGSSSSGSDSGGGDSGGSAAPRVAQPRMPEMRVEPAERPAPNSPESPRVRTPDSSGPRAAGTTRARSSGGASPQVVAGRASSDVRSRGNRGVVGYAQPRTGRSFGSGTNVYYLYPPWYSRGISSHFGLGYDPWGYRGHFGWSRYGFYDPFLYPYGHPYGSGYGLYGYPYSYGAYGIWPGWIDMGGGYADDDQEYEDGARYGSLRLRADPKDARVYVDGALAGTVDDFDGLTGHLRLEAGPHQIELRADGYQTFTTTVVVEPGKTRTQRVDLKRAN